MNVAPLISVIVPIYNVEKYVRKCLDSLKGQSLKEIEVICIDDGSTDKSGAIADEYMSDGWPMVKVIHTENRGLSAARNKGIGEASADWIMFVDSDDWVEQGFCEISYRTAMENKADMVIFRAHEAKIIHQDFLIGVVDAETAVRYGEGYAWNKLYNVKLFNGITYPEGRIYEDLAVTHKLIFAAHKIVIIPVVLVHHIYRKGSLSHSKIADNKRDGFIFALQRTDYLKAYGCNKATYMPTLVSYALGFLARTDHADDPLFVQAENVLDSVKEKPSELSWQKKVMFSVWKIDKRLFHFICRISGQKDNGSIGVKVDEH